MSIPSQPNSTDVRRTAKDILQELARFGAEPPFISYVHTKNHQPDPVSYTHLTLPTKA